MSTDNSRQASLYASPLAQHRTLSDLSGRSSPQPPRYSSRPQSPRNMSPSVELLEDKVNHHITTNGRRQQYEYKSPSTLERELGVHRQRSPLPRLVSTESTSPATMGSLASPRSSFNLPSRLPLSPRLLGSKSHSGETSSTSFDSDQLRSISRRSNGSQHQRSNSTEGLPFKRWGSFTSPSSMHRMQKPYIPTNLGANEGSDGQFKASTGSNRSENRHLSPLQQPKLPLSESHVESRLDSANQTAVDCVEREASSGNSERSSYPLAGSKRKHQHHGEDNGGQSETSTAHSNHPNLAATSSHLDGDKESARRGKIGSTPSTERHAMKSMQATVMQEQDELEEEDETMEAVPSNGTRINDGVPTNAPQRKSCDRCFKMKTKVRERDLCQNQSSGVPRAELLPSTLWCSRATPGAAGDAPCDGCVRRGFGDDCITSRPDFPYPRISLPKRARRESSLPTLLNLSDSAVFVPPSMMQRSNDWRTRLIVDSLHKNGSSDNNEIRNRSQPPPLPQEQQQHSMESSHSARYSSTGKHADQTSRTTPVRSQGGQSFVPSNSTTAWSLHGQNSVTPPMPSKEGGHSNRLQHVSHLRSLPTSELRDLSISIAKEVTQRSQPAPAPSSVKTPVVPSASIPGHGASKHQQYSTYVSRNAVPAPGGSLGQQAMQNAPMQLLPKAIGLPALDYFDQLIFPLFPVSLLSAKMLTQRYESYVKPGRNNVLELAMAIGLQLQGILLSCPDTSQANTAEGRIFKAFLQSSKQRTEVPLLPSLSRQDGKNTPIVAAATDSRVSIDSVKGWIEPARHRSRAKEIVKHVMMRRCLKSGLDYDDVLETILIAYYHMIRGDVTIYHILTGNAQRQVELLTVQQSPRDALWTEQDMLTTQAKVNTMECLHPINFFVQLRTSSTPTTSQDERPIDNEFISLQGKLSEIASFVQSFNGSKDKGSLVDEVDERLTSFRKSLPSHLQVSVRNEWITSNSQVVDGGDWISDMMRGGSMTPSLRLNVCINVSFIRLAARQHCFVQAMDNLEEQSVEDSKDKSVLNKASCQDLCQLRHISSSIISSTLLAITVCPHLICLSQVFAAELTASAWNYIISQILLLEGSSSSSSSSELQEVKENPVGLLKMEEHLTQLADILATCQEKEAWPFVASLSMVKSIIKALQEQENGAKKWLSILRLYSITHPESFARILQGDAWAVDELRRERTTII